MNLGVVRCEDLSYIGLAQGFDAAGDEFEVCNCYRYLIQWLSCPKNVFYKM